MRRFISILLLFTFCLAGVSFSAADVVAVVNGEKITSDDMKRTFEVKHSGHSALLNNDADRKMYLDILIDRTLLIQEGHRLGFNNDPAVKERVAGYTEDQAIGDLYKREVTDKIIVPPEEIEKVYNDYYGKLLNISLIYVKKEDQAREIAAELNNGVSFEKLAKERSLDPSSVRGGNIGDISWGVLDPAVEKVLFALKPLNVSEVVKTFRGYFIFKLYNIKDVKKGTFEEVKNQIDAVIRKRKTSFRHEEYLSELKMRNSVTQFPERIAEGREGACAASINGEIVFTVAQVRARMQTNAGVAGPNILEAMVNRELLRREALLRGLFTLPEIEERAAKYMETVILDRVYQVMEKNIARKPGDVQEYFSQHREDFCEPDTYLISQIIVKSSNDAENILSNLKAGGDFAALARQFSIDHYAGAGGDMGYLPLSSMQPEVAQVIGSLTPGAYSGIIQTKYGFHLILLRDRKKGREQTFEEAGDKVEKAFLAEMRKEEKTRWIKTLRDGARIKIRIRALRGVEF